MAMGKDLYAVLGVSRTATDDEIRRVYRKLARKHHPDVNPGKKDAEERFKEVNAAYEVLSNSDKRKLYDEFGEDSLRSGFDPEATRAWRHVPPHGGGAPFGGGRAPFEGFEGGTFTFDPSDLFGDMFGTRRRGGGIARERPELHAVVEIELADAIHGTEIQLCVPSHEPCPQCHGTGNEAGAQAVKCADCRGTGRVQAGGDRIRMMTACPHCGGVGSIRTPCHACAGSGHVSADRTITVRIPKGADHGSRLRVARPDGDVVIETRVRPHPFFRREGLDLFLRLPITVDEAYNGAKVSVPTPDGLVEMRVPPRSQNGARLRLRGKGVERGSKRGDLYVDLDVKLPDADDARFADAVRAATGAYTKPVREGIRL